MFQFLGKLYISFKKYVCSLFCVCKTTNDENDQSIYTIQDLKNIQDQINEVSSIYEITSMKSTEV